MGKKVTGEEKPEKKKQVESGSDDLDS